jgi:hypothetical protein
MDFVVFMSYLGTFLCGMMFTTLALGIAIWRLRPPAVENVDDHFDGIVKSLADDPTDQPHLLQT